MKYIAVIILLLSTSNLSAARTKEQNPFLMSPSEKTTDFKKQTIGFIYNDPDDAKWFYENRNKVKEHPADLEVVHNFLLRLFTYHTNYSSEQIDELLLLSYTALEKVELTDKNISRVEIYKGGFSLRISRLYYEYRGDTKKLEHHKFLITELIEKRKKYFNKKYNNQFQEHESILDLLATINRFLKEEEVIVFTLSDVKEKWPNASSHEKKQLINALDNHEDNIAWAKEQLKAKNNQVAVKLLLTLICKHLDLYPENKAIILEFIGKNQRSPYKKIAIEYIGETEVTEYLNSISNQ